jgi:uncharacterized membrane protein
MKSTLLFILFYGICLSAFAQQVSLSGKVVDAGGKPVPFASVYIKNTSNGASANIEGDYSIKLQPGQYEVQYKAVGYKQESRSIDLKYNSQCHPYCRGL